jgi:N-acetyl sugar amidotransferase
MKLKTLINYNMSEIKICTRCVMDTTATEITFDNKGVCNFCHQYDNVTTKDLYVDKGGEERLNNLIKKIKKGGKNRQYDVLIGISGGVDSSYVAYLVKKVYGLRALAVHLDNGWNSELAVANVEHVVRKLDMDLSTYVLDWKEFKDIQTSFLKASVSNIEIPTDHAIWALLIKTAAKHKISYIIAGNNVVTESIMPSSWLYGSKDFRFIKSIHKQFGKVKLNTYPSLTTFDYINYLLLKGIRWVPILNYINFVKNDAKQLLIDELEWRDYGGKHYESIFTRFFHSYYLPVKFGYDLRKSYLSALVCSGQMRRDEALDELKKPPLDKNLLEQDKIYVLKKLGLTESEFEQILNNPNKKFSEYPNNDSLWRNFGFLIKIARNIITRVK